MTQTLNIEEINSNDQTVATRKHLEYFCQKFDLSPFIFTKQIQITSDGTSQSHPVLTLSTKSFQYPERILSIFLHEQFHWWADAANDDDFRSAMNDLKKIYPELPKEGVSHSVFSTYLHLIICWLEYKATSKIIGEEEAHKVILSYIHETHIYEKQKTHSSRYLNILGYLNWRIQFVFKPEWLRSGSPIGEPIRTFKYNVLII